MPTFGHARLLLLAVLVMLSGCRQEVRERKYRAVSGKASAIDFETGRVSMDWQSKNGETQTFTGLVTQDTEILINGISAGLEDVRIGDPVEVVVYAAPHQQTIHEGWIVTSVRIERDESFVLEMDVPDG